MPSSRLRGNSVARKFRSWRRKLNGKPMWLRLRTMVSFTLLGVTVAGCFGYHDDKVQWTAGLLGAYLGGMIAD